MPLEKRVASTPDAVKKLTDLKFEVVVESGAGAAAGFSDEAYVAAGAAIVTRAAALAADVVVKVRPPTEAEIAALKEGGALISLIQPERNTGILEALNARRITVVALERVPRTTRAQKMDVLSSMANLAGYRAVMEAVHEYQSFFGQQVTAAGSTPPAKVLVIGAGVAGLAAIGAARALGADVRAFDTRAAAKEQVESMGARFLTLQVEEKGEGAGGYAKVMSKAFIDAEMALFREQAKDIDIVITTALVPGSKAPTLLPTDVVECFKPGSVIVDMAAEQGGNCELCRAGEIVVHKGVRIIGFTDLASRMATIASKFFATNIVNLVADMGGAEKFRIDEENDVVRPSTLAHQGKILPPPGNAPDARKNQPPPPKPPPADAKPKQVDIMTPTRKAWGSTIGGGIVIALLFMIGRFAPKDFLQHSTVFILACFVGWQVIWSVSPALHTPLMSVTNAISGIIVVGGMLQISGEKPPMAVDWAALLGAAAVLFATINVAGGFLVTQRMLKMFRREEGPKR